jgi:hypothetical protein
LHFTKTVVLLLIMPSASDQLIGTILKHDRKITSYKSLCYVP